MKVNIYISLIALNLSLIGTSFADNGLKLQTRY